MNFRLQLSALALGVGLALTGCSGSPEASVYNGVSPSPPAARTVVGKLYLGTFVGEATITLQDQAGQTLATARTNPGGVAFFHDLTAPRDFRAVARLEGSSTEFAAELRGFDQSNRQVLINIPTTLASRYLREHPEANLSEAESRIRWALALPSVLMLDIGVGEAVNGFFSHIDYFLAASRQGGFEAFSRRVLEQAANHQGTAYTLELKDLRGPITGLGDNRLDAVANGARLRMRRLLSLSPEGTRLKGDALAAADGPTTLGGQFLLGIGTGVGGNLITFGLNAVVGWAANQMGLNYGTSGQLQEIQATLNDVLGETSEIETALANQNVRNQVLSVYNQTVPVQTATNSMVNQLAVQNTTSNQPFAPPNTYATFISAINTPNYPGIATNISTGLLGAGGAIMSAQNIVLNEGLGLDSQPQFQSYPMRTNHVLYNLLEVYNYFAYQQTLLYNLYAETAHNFILNPNPVDGVNNSQPLLNSLPGSLKTQRQQQGLLTSQWAPIIDYENAVMWCDNMGSPATWSETVSDVNSLSYQLILPDGSSVVYDDWRLPTYGECVSLQQRGKYNPKSVQPQTPSVPVNSHNSYPDTGQATAGLPGLGFQNVAEALSAAPNDNGSNGDMWMSYVIASANGNVWEVSFANNYEFRLNHSSENTNQESNSSDRNVYLACRTFGLNPVLSPYAFTTGQTTGPNQQPLPSPTQYAGQSLSAGEISQYGVPTNITGLTLAPAATPSPSPIAFPAGSLQLDATLTYQVSVGGTFTLGYQKTTSVTNPSHTYAGNVSTKPQNDAPALLRQLVQWDTSNFRNTAVSNLPGLDGLVTSFNTLNVTLSATLLGGGGITNKVTGSLAYTPPAAVNRTLTSIQISPRNQVYGEGGQPAAGTDLAYPYFCTGFYSDGSLATLGGNATTWTVSSNPAGARMVVNNGGATLQMNAPPGSSAYNVTINATVNGTADSTLIQIQPPVATP